PGRRSRLRAERPPRPLRHRGAHVPVRHQFRTAFDELAVTTPAAPTTPPPQVAAALAWAERVSLPVSALEDPAVVRAALDACARTVTGRPRPRVSLQAPPRAAYLVSS